MTLFIYVKGKTKFVLPKNKVLQTSDVSGPWSHSRNSLLTRSGQWVPCYSQTNVGGRPVLTCRRYGQFET